MIHYRPKKTPIDFDRHRSKVKVTASVFVPFLHPNLGFWMVSWNSLHRISPNLQEWCIMGQRRHLTNVTYIGQRSRSQQPILFRFCTRTWVRMISSKSKWCIMGERKDLLVLTFTGQRSRSQQPFLFRFRTRTWVSGWYLRRPFIEFHQIHRNDAL